MPYFLQKVKGTNKYFVVDTTGDRYSKKPLTKARAEKQITALHINTGHGMYSEGGMMRVSNPLVPQVTPEQEAKAVIQRILNSANSARSMSITMAEGHKSMEKIMNEAALELFKAGKAGAVKYLNDLRAPYESREDYKKDDSVERNKVATEMGLEIKYGGSRKNYCGSFSEPDTHILIGDELDGSGRKADLRKEYDAIMRRPDLTPQQREDIVRTFQATNQRLAQAGKSYSTIRRLVGLPETETGRTKNRLFQQGSLAMQRLAPVRLIQRNPLHMIGNVNAELAQQEALDDALGVTGYANPAADDEDPEPPAQNGEGKYKFIKKYLKGQGLPATKKNIAKICNIMDVEGIVFE